MWESKDSAFPSLLASSFSLPPTSLLSLSQRFTQFLVHTGGQRKMKCPRGQDDTKAKQGHEISRNFAETWRVKGWKTVTVGDTTTSR